MTEFTNLFNLIESIIDAESKYHTRSLITYISNFFSETTENGKLSYINLYGSHIWYKYLINYKYASPKSIELINDFLEKNSFCKSITPEQINKIREEFNIYLQKQEHNYNYYRMFCKILYGFVCKFHYDTLNGEINFTEFDKPLYKILKFINKKDDEFLTKIQGYCYQSYEGCEQD